MTLPELLTPNARHPITLPTGTIVDVPKATPTFRLWHGPPVADTYNGKQILDFKGRPAFAELVILWSLMEVGWRGVWIDTYREAYRTGYWGVPPLAQLPAQQAQLLSQVFARIGSWSGSWDVFGWSGPSVLFVESKRRSRDAIRKSQARWLAAALDTGLPLASFLVVEWGAA